MRAYAQSPLALAPCVALLLLAVTSCGYSTGLVPPAPARTVGVDFFGNEGQLPDLERDLHRQLVRSLGNLVADAMLKRERVEADFALTNSLGIRTNFHRGAVTLEQMFNVFPFENSITKVLLSGGEIVEIAEVISAVVIRWRLGRTK